MKNNLHIFLGATVADAAARPLHWVYDQKKLNSYIKNKKDFAFLKNNKSPFYNIKTGKVSGYNEVGQVMFNTIIKEIDLTKSNVFGQKNLNLTVKKIERRFKTNVIKHFGQGSLFWKNLKTRNKYKKIKWTKPINGPWIHQNVIDTIKNIKAKKKVTGSIKVNESDGFCAALPYFSIFNDFKRSLVASSASFEDAATRALRERLSRGQRPQTDELRAAPSGQVRRCYAREIVSRV